MTRLFQQFGRLLTCLLFGLALELPAQVLTPTLPGKGKDANTLLIFSDRHSPYSMADAVTALKLQLRRVATQVEEVSAAAADTAAISNVDYLVIFCPQPFPEFSDTVLQAIIQRQGPVLWVGYGADQLQKIPPFENKFQVAAYASETPAQTISYQGRTWNETLKIWIPTQLSASETGNVIMSVPSTETNVPASALAWKTAQITFFTALPTFTASGALFSDMVLDFYGVTSAPAGAVALFIEGYHCRHNHEEFRNLVKYLSERNHPFIVGVIPAYYDAVRERVLDLDSQPEFVAALRFAQQRGGRLVMQGYLHAYKGRTGYEPEFWDAASDRPLPDDSAEYVRNRVTKGLEQMFARGLLPVGWQTPNYSASRIDYAEIAKFFSTAVERVQLSDATARENFGGSACSTDDFGRLIVPDNLVAMSPIRNPSPLLRMLSRAEVLGQLRGTVVTVSFPAFLKDDKLAQVVTMLEQVKSPFLDLAEGDHWVQTADTLLLTGKARHTMVLNNARVRWQAFDRTGKRIAEDIEPTPVTGEREFVRRGKGDYEIYQFNQGKP